MSGEPVIREYRPGDEHGILASFNVVFREVCGPGYQDRDLAFWRWLFEQNPAGRRITVAVAPDGTIAAHYAGIPYVMQTLFGDCVFGQGVDSFVHPRFRAGLKKPGLFVETAIPWFADAEARGDAVIYGYPVPVAERIGARALGYTHVRVVNYLCRDVARPALAPANVPVEAVRAVPADIEALRVRCERGKGCAIRRDARYLEWRYLRCPGEPYVLLAARRAGALCGLAALRPVHELVPGACGIADWLVPPEDGETADALVAAAAEHARAAGRSVLLAVFPDPAPEHGLFRARGFEVRPSSQWLERRLMHRSFDARMTTAWLAEHWWYTLGDSDLV